MSLNWSTMGASILIPSLGTAAIFRYITITFHNVLCTLWGGGSWFQLEIKENRASLQARDIISMVLKKGLVPRPVAEKGLNKLINKLNKLGILRQR